MRTIPRDTLTLHLSHTDSEMSYPFASEKLDKAITSTYDVTGLNEHWSAVLRIVHHVASAARHQAALTGHNLEGACDERVPCVL